MIEQLTEMVWQAAYDAAGGDLPEDDSFSAVSQVVADLGRAPETDEEIDDVLTACLGEGPGPDDDRADLRAAYRREMAALMARRRLITIDPEDQEEGFGRFVHVDEVTAVAQERDHLRQSLDAIRDHLGIPADIDHLGLVSIVERHRLDITRVIRGGAVHTDQMVGLLRAVAVALGHPDQGLADLADSVEALRLQRDHLLTERDAYRAAVLRLARAVASPGARDMVELMVAEEASDVADIVLERLQIALASALNLQAAAQAALSLGLKP